MSKDIKIRMDKVDGIPDRGLPRNVLMTTHIGRMCNNTSFPRMSYCIAMTDKGPKLFFEYWDRSALRWEDLKSPDVAARECKRYVWIGKRRNPFNDRMSDCFAEIMGDLPHNENQ